MATTRIMPLYMNKSQSAGNTIRDILNYVEDPGKASQDKLIMAHGRSSSTTDTEFLFNRRQYLAGTDRRKEANDVVAYHVRQAFVPGEVAPKKANRIGVEFTKRFTEDSHAFIIYTHIDRTHIRSHIIRNSTSLDYAHKFYNS